MEHVPNPRFLWIRNTTSSTIGVGYRSGEGSQTEGDVYTAALANGMEHIDRSKGYGESAGGTGGTV
jgi:diketogulonate reductase-like aldo/keto reductase